MTALRRRAGLATVTIVVLSFYECVAPPEGDVPLFRTEEWESLYGPDPEGKFDEVDASSGLAELQMRQVDADGGDLLLTLEGISILGRSEADSGWVVTNRVHRFPVYRFERESQSLTVVPDEVWEQAAGPTKSFGDSGEAPGLLWDQKAYSLFLHDREIKAAGRLVVWVARAPNRNLAAVMSAGGPAVGSIMPFIGGGGAAGQHYHQVLSLDDGRFIGEPVQLPFDTKRNVFSMSWSPSEDTLVYKSPFSGQLAFVPFDRPQEPEL